VADEQFFGMLYTIDEDDDWRSERALRKANPNWGVSVMPDVVLAACARAVQSPSRAAAFKQKHLNIWTNADQEWMDMLAWARAADPTLRREDFIGCDCFVGVDLATKIDLAAIVILYWKEIEGVLHYYLFADFFLPQAAVDKVRNDNYAGWARDRFIQTTAGECNDMGAITRWLLDIHRENRLVDLAYDPWQALQMAQTLSDEGVSVIEYRPTVQNFSAPMKELDGLVREGRLHHDGNPVMTYCVSCVRVQEDFKGNIFPRKDKTDRLKKIDGVVAALMALGRKMVHDATEGDPSIAVL
jgi:phage terminase large subunit-like protein